MNEKFHAEERARDVAEALAQQNAHTRELEKYIRELKARVFELEEYGRGREAVIADLRAELPLFSWQPIANAPSDEPLILYAPPENLYEEPEGHEGDIVIRRKHDYCWATHWMRRPASPNTSSQT